MGVKSSPSTHTWPFLFSRSNTRVFIYVCVYTNYVCIRIYSYVFVFINLDNFSISVYLKISRVFYLNKLS